MRTLTISASNRARVARWLGLGKRPGAGMLPSILVAILTISAALPANADFECNETDQHGMNECAYDQFKNADKKLNAKYNMIMSCLKKADSQKDQMIKAQRAWIKFREAECEFQLAVDPKEPMGGGTMHPMLLGICQKEMTEKRIKDLDEMIACAGGERGGICPTIDCDFHQGKKP